MDKLYFDDKWEFADLANFSPIVTVTPPGPMYFDSLVHDCGNSIVNALEFPQSCTKPLV